MFCGYFCSPAEYQPPSFCLVEPLPGWTCFESKKEKDDIFLLSKKIARAETGFFNPVKRENNHPEKEYQQSTAALPGVVLASDDMDACFFHDDSRKFETKILIEFKFKI